MKELDEFWRNYKCCSCPNCGERENITRRDDDCYCEECCTTFAPYPKDVPCDE